VAADTPSRLPGAGEDPYEFDWPDDAKETRAAEREAARKAANRPQARRILTAWALGVAVQLTFFGVVLGVAGLPRLFAVLVLPTVVVATVFALPVGILLGKASEKWRPGFGEATFLAVGMAFGFSWGWGIFTYIPELFLDDLELVENARDVASVFLLTSVGSAFFVARIATDVVRRNRLVVRIMLATIGVLSLWSLTIFISAAL
jgi:hypothetical protein